MLYLTKNNITYNYSELMGSKCQIVISCLGYEYFSDTCLFW